MIKSHSIAEVRQDLSHLVHEVEKGQVLQLTRHGHPVAVMISELEFERLQGKKMGFWEAFQPFCQTYSNGVIERKEFAPKRSKEKGRSSPWK